MRSSSPSPKREAHLEVVGRAAPAMMASPHSMSVTAAVVEHLGEAEVEHLVELLEPVDVEVVQRRAGPRSWLARA